MTTTHKIRVDRKRPLREGPHTGHNRSHPRIPAILVVDLGDVVVMEAWDAHPLQANYGLSCEQAYVLPSVAVGMRISQAVDVPTY